ncbi:3-oxoacyl-ACP reductase FabG [uncultured Rikenella sp.]|uniref:3-oxoacyl-ACP reductase FabG n=1 Tax=uncultured Rikenella sp. TaxID=368003 RepID=UPI002618A4D7|nr:3-oxoacyl-ACP reductase FabG [uncultured Rikenella sp.]
MTTSRYALITGASRGIGRAIALRLAADGYHILLNYQTNRSAAEAVLNDIRTGGGDGTLLPFDVTDPEAVEQAIDTWRQQHPDSYISLLVNNAGIRHDDLLMWMSGDNWHRVLSTTLDGFFHVTRALLQEMLVRKWGRIINIASLSGLSGMPGQTNYSAAKGGLIAATKSLAREVARKHVTVNAIAPGFIRTDMTSDLDETTLKKTIPAGRFGEAEEVAHLVSFLASDHASYITGEVISIDGGLS